MDGEPRKIAARKVKDVFISFLLLLYSHLSVYVTCIFTYSQFFFIQNFCFIILFTWLQVPFWLPTFVRDFLMFTVLLIDFPLWQLVTTKIIFLGRNLVSLFSNITNTEFNKLLFIFLIYSFLEDVFERLIVSPFLLKMIIRSVSILVFSTWCYHKNGGHESYKWQLNGSIFCSTPVFFFNL